MTQTKTQNAAFLKQDHTARKLNLACGHDIRPSEANWLNVDVIEGPGIERVDIYTLPWPMKEEEFDYVLASHILEHVPFHLPQYGHSKNFLIMLMEEIWRVLKTGGIVEIIVPGGIDSLAHAIDHKRIITAKTFHVFYPGDDWSYYTKCRFQLVVEQKRESWSFRALRYLSNKLFMINIDMLASCSRTIVLKKLSPGTRKE